MNSPVASARGHGGIFDIFIGFKTSAYILEDVVRSVSDDVHVGIRAETVTQPKWKTHWGLYKQMMDVRKNF